MEPTGDVERQQFEAYRAWVQTLSPNPPRVVTLPWTTIVCFTFPDEPDDGWQITLTYGLSANSQDALGNELLLCVQSADESWQYAVMQMAHERQGTRLEAGMTDLWSRPLAEDTSMSALVLWHPIALPEGVAPVVHLPDRHVVVLQAFPVHEEEVTRLREVPAGLPRERAAKQFLVSLEDAVYQPSRPPRGFTNDDDGA